MTCVAGHLTRMDFGPDYKDWKYPPPDRLFEAPVHTIVPEVSCSSPSSPQIWSWWTL